VRARTVCVLVTKFSHTHKTRFSASSRLRRVLLSESFSKTQAGNTAKTTIVHIDINVKICRFAGCFVVFVRRAARRAADVNGDVDSFERANIRWPRSRSPDASPSDSLSSGLAYTVIADREPLWRSGDESESRRHPVRNDPRDRDRPSPQ